MRTQIIFIAAVAAVTFVCLVPAVIWFLRRVVSRWVDQGRVRPSQVTATFFLAAGVILLSSALLLPNSLVLLALCYALFGSMSLASAAERFMVPRSVEQKPVWYEGGPDEPGTTPQAWNAPCNRRFSLLWLGLVTGCLCASLALLTSMHEWRRGRVLAHERALAQIVDLGGTFKQGDVSLVNTSVQDEDLSCLADLQHVTGLMLGKTSITNRGLRHIAALDELTTLSLSGTEVDDVGLQHLKNLKHLKHVSLRATKVSGIGVAFATEAPLEYLDLSRCPVSSSGLRQLAQQPCVHLSLAETSVNDEMIDDLAAIRVRHLDLMKTQLSPNSLSSLRQRQPQQRIRFEAPTEE